MAAAGKQRRRASLVAERADPQDEGAARIKRVSWENDGEPGESSLNVLLAWLDVPGNYERWFEQGRIRSEAVRELRGELDKKNRNELSIRGKIAHLEEQCAAAIKFLKGKRISSEAAMSSSLDSEVEAELKKLCPHFRDLKPMLQRLDKAPNTNAGVDADANGKARRVGETGSSKRRKTTQNAAATPPVTHTLDGEAQEVATRTTKSVRRCTDISYGVPPSSRNCSFGFFNVTSQETSFQPSSEYQQGLEKIGLEHQQKHSELILEDEKERLKALRDVAEKMEKFEMNVGMMRARQKLKEGGFTKKFIAQSVPPPEK